MKKCDVSLVAVSLSLLLAMSSCATSGAVSAPASGVESGAQESTATVPAEAAPPSDAATVGQVEQALPATDNASTAVAPASQAGDQPSVESPPSSAEASTEDAQSSEASPAQTAEAAQPEQAATNSGMATPQTAAGMELPASEQVQPAINSLPDTEEFAPDLEAPSAVSQAFDSLQESAARLGRDKADEARSSALSAEAEELARDRFEKADEAYGQAAEAFGAGDYLAAADLFGQAASIYRVSELKTVEGKLRDQIEAQGYAKYMDSYFAMGQASDASEEESWKAGSPRDILDGIDSLEAAKEYFSFVVEKGAEYKSLEGKDAAAAAKDGALGERADLNAAGEYSSAEDIMVEALAEQERGNYESSYPWFGDAAEAYKKAGDAALALRAVVQESLGAAESAVEASDTKAQDAGIGDNGFLGDAKASLGEAKLRFEDKRYDEARVSADQARASAGLSDELVAQKLRADASAAEARGRVARATEVGLELDYPTEYRDAQSSMDAAAIAYGRGKYVAAAELTDEVNVLISDDFQAKVAADRKAAQIGKAGYSEFAGASRAGAAEAEAAQAEAQDRLVWAEGNGIPADYPSIYGAAAQAMRSSFGAYQTGAYDRSTSKAKEATSILSDEFMARVAADRKAKQEAALQAAAEKAAAEKAAAEAAARRAAEEAAAQEAAAREAAAKAAAMASAKAAAEKAMTEAERRMSWACENGIATEYPGEYKTGSGAMGASLLAFGGQEYPTAEERASVVSATFSDEFMARVAADRKAKQEAALQAAAEKAAAEAAAKAAAMASAKAAAEKAMAEAERRMSWAQANGVAADYPAEYGAASTAMTGSHTTYAKEQYAEAEKDARQVSSILSDEFMARVAADRKAKQEAALKAAAEKAMAEAERRMSWAKANGVAADYPAEYGAASTAMTGSHTTYAKEQYAEAEKDARQVSSILSDEFMARVAADRKAKQEAALAMPPAVQVSVKPELFSPDGDGENDTLTFGINASSAAGIADWRLDVFETAVSESTKTTATGRLFTSWSGKGAPPSAVTWNGKSSRGELVESATDYNYKLVVGDQRGRSTTVSGTISVDVLIIRSGNQIKINVPSIMFRPDYADFVGLDAGIVERNERVVARVAQILNRFPGYKVTVQGHANSISKITGQSQAKIQAEETNELIPLSKGRAEFVRAMLVRNGVDPKRLGVQGLGSSQPVVSFQDAENRWKNRRVEFVLVKNR